MKTRNEVMSLICTSVSDAEITLKSMVKREPEQAKEIAIEILKKLQGSEGQKTRIALAERIIRQADKAIKSK